MMRTRRRRKKRTLLHIMKLTIVVGLIYIAMANKHLWIAFAKNTGILILMCVTSLLALSMITKMRKYAYRQKENRIYLGSDIRHVDTLSGIEFERYLRAHFKSKGYRVFLTPPQHDYGVDLVLTKDGDKIAVQAKRYNHEQGYKVTYKAVQEVSAGKAYYGCNKGIVITNSFFTKSARELAECNNIDMWDRHRLIEEFRIDNAPNPRAYKDGYYPGTVTGMT